MWGNGCTTPSILYLGVGGVVSFMHHLPYLWEGEVLVPLGRWLGGSQRWSGCCGEVLTELLLLECLGPFFITSKNHLLCQMLRNVHSTLHCIVLCSFQACIPDGHLYRVTYTRCRIDTIVSPDDEHMAARNM